MNMKYLFSDLVVLSDIQSLLDAFRSANGLAAEILDLNTQGIVASSGRKCCHAHPSPVHPPGQTSPLSCDAIVSPTRKFDIQRYKCSHGLIHYSGVICVENMELAAVLLGPVFHASPDEEQLRWAAQETCIDEGGFWEEARRAPINSEEQAASYTELLVQVVRSLAEKGLHQLRLKETLIDSQARQETLQKAYSRLEDRIRTRTDDFEKANAALQESEQRFRVALLDTPIVVFNQDLALRFTWMYNPPAYLDQPIIGKTDADLFSPDDAMRLTALKRRVIATGLLSREEVSVTAGGQTLVYDMTLDPLYDAGGAVIGLTCAAMDITERKNIEEEIRRRLVESEGIQRIAKGLLQKIGLDEVLEIVCTEAMKLTSAEGSAVLLLDKDGWLRLTQRAGSPIYNLDRLPVGGSFAGQAVITRSHVWVDRQGGEPSEAAGEWLGYPWTPGLLSMLSVPLQVNEQVIGVLNILNKPGDLTQEDIRIIDLFADQAAMIIEHVSLQHQAGQFAVLKERQRLARELHDSVTQALYSVNLYADAARKAFTAERWEDLERNLREVRNMAHEAMYDMRLLVFELRPFMLEEEGLASALRARLAAVEGRAGLKTEVRVEGERRLPIVIEEEIYRIAQEGLNNVVKHAEASEVQIDLRYGAETIQLEMVDNGQGFDPQNTGQSGGDGLQGIRERVQELDGSLEIESSFGKGTRLTVILPLHRLES
jgi:PAS domain S-box-containing protein